MLREYEFTMIVRPDLSEEDVGAVLAHYEQKIAARDGRVLKKEAVGTKRFSYPIKKCFRGYFVNYDISADPKIVKDMEHQIRFDDKILRHLIVGMDRRKAAAVKAEVAAEQTRSAATQAASTVESDTATQAASTVESDTTSSSATQSATQGNDVPPSRDATVASSTSPAVEESLPDNQAAADAPADEVVDASPPRPAVSDSEPAAGEGDEQMERPRE